QVGSGDGTAASGETKRTGLQHFCRRLGAERRRVPTPSGRWRSTRDPVARCRNGQCQMQLQGGQGGGWDDVAYSSRVLLAGAVVECQRKPEVNRIEPEMVERARLGKLRAMREAVTSPSAGGRIRWAGTRLSS